jgi:hypothetical protein
MPALLTSTSGPAELVLHALSGGDERVAVGDVGLDRNRGVAEFVGERLDAISAPGQQGGDAVALGSQCPGGGLADARRGASDDRDAAGVVRGAHGNHSARARDAVGGPVKGASTGPLSASAQGLRSGHDRW